MKSQRKKYNHSPQTNGRMTREIQDHLEMFFEFVPPNQFREHLLEVYHSYIFHEHHSSSSEFKSMSESMMMFFDFLKFVEEEFNQRGLYKQKKRVHLGRASR